MPMTKAEKAMAQELRVQAALRWTGPVLPDVPPPGYSWKPGEKAFTSGWMRHGGSSWDGGRVEQPWSSATGHGSGPAPSSNISGRQNSSALFSTKLLALRALRHDVERSSAEKLARIDAWIEEEVANGQA